MADNPRRRFLKASAGFASGLALVSCADEEQTPAASSPALDPKVLSALALIVLPRTALGNDGVLRIVADFLAWLDGFDPVSERDHPYGDGDISYGPPDPAPLWQSQLEALNLETQKRYAVSFVEAGETRQREVLKRQLPANLPEDMPYAGRATHVAIGLMAFFYATPEANDLALDAKVGRETCRGLESGASRPAPLEP